MINSAYRYLISFPIATQLLQLIVIGLFLEGIVIELLHLGHFILNETFFEEFIFRYMYNEILSSEKSFNAPP